MRSLLRSKLGDRTGRLPRNAARQSLRTRPRTPPTRRQVEWLEQRMLLSTISGQKFNDLDGDGTSDGGGDPGLGGWMIQLDADADGTVDQTTTTAPNGTYRFDGLGPGTYRVREVSQTGWVQTTPHPADIVLDGTNDVSGVEFGNFQRIAISGRKFEDHNGNGEPDTGDQGLPGWVIFLDANGSGTLDPGETNVTTDASGNYGFTDLGPGTYRVREVVQPGWTQTTANRDFTASSGTSIASVNFGNFQNITISGQKFEDRDGDGVKEGGEVGLAGWTIFLDANNSGTLNTGETSVTTDADGRYSLGNLGPGTYRVREVLQSGFTQTTANPAPIVASSGTNVSDVDFGNFQTITISGQKFNDLNGNGVKDGNEPGLAGWQIFLDRDLNGVFGPGDTSATTDAGGNYSFTAVLPGTHRVREVLQTGWRQTTPDPADIVAVSGQPVSGVNFGNFQNITISGQKFNDLNGNGTKDSGEPDLAGWTIFLDTDGDGVRDAEEPSTTTDDEGDYSFTDLGPGTYRVREELQTGWVQTTPNPEPIVAASGQDRSNIVFGNFQRITISGQKFADLDGDGVKDAGEPGVAGWTIFLDVNDNGTVEIGEPRTSTGADGNYTFADLGPGTYRVREVLQAGWTQTLANPAEITAASGANRTGVDFGNRPPVVVLIPDPSDTTQLAMLVTGTAGNDRLSLRGTEDVIFVRHNRQSLGPFIPSGRIMVFGLAGNDKISVASTIDLPGELHGGDGADQLRAGSANSLLLGDAGDDDLIGGDGDDLLIGGRGADTVRGNAGDDIVIGTVTNFDATDAALREVLAEWTTARDYSIRVANLRTGSGSADRRNGTTFLNFNAIPDDAVVDQLSGGPGRDWFLAHLQGVNKDARSDQAANEVVDAV